LSPVTDVALIERLRDAIDLLETIAANRGVLEGVAEK
jgi:hypothetical protein